MMVAAALPPKPRPGRPWSMSRRVLALLAEGPLTARSISDILESTPPHCPTSTSRRRAADALYELRCAKLITRAPIDPKQALGSKVIYSITAAGLAELAKRTPELVTH